MPGIDWNAVRAYYDDGHSMRECKEAFGFSNYAWDKAVIEGLVVPRQNPRKQWKHDTRRAVRRLIDRGLTHSEIAFELGVSKPTVTYHARRLGVPPTHEPPDDSTGGPSRPPTTRACRRASAARSSAARDRPGNTRSGRAGWWRGAA